MYVGRGSSHIELSLLSLGLVRCAGRGGGGVVVLVEVPVVVVEVVVVVVLLNWNTTILRPRGTSGFFLMKK